MPLIRGEQLEDRIRNTRKLLTSAAVIMSVLLMATSIVTTLLIPAEAFAENGPANGRAMAYLAHQYLGNGFGTLYDISTILILAFAGASAMAGLLNLIPRYLPRFGMAPEWALASRPLVLVFMGTALLVTLLFHANDRTTHLADMNDRPSIGVGYGTPQHFVSDCREQARRQARLNDRRWHQRRFRTGCVALTCGPER